MTDRTRPSSRLRLPVAPATTLEAVVTCSECLETVQACDAVPNTRGTQMPFTCKDCDERHAYNEKRRARYAKRKGDA